MRVSGQRRAQTGGQHPAGHRRSEPHLQLDDRADRQGAAGVGEHPQLTPPGAEQKIERPGASCNAATAASSRSWLRATWYQSSIVVTPECEASKRPSTVPT
ncbi:hypothetical protein AB0N87_42505 [Streptomyces sp. NPDC093228]|uniref:hypothetical protein n=1 Tax=Streptomyces sp. NPDC093228 TaxID=3155070 RepID=UPI00341FD226